MQNTGWFTGGGFGSFEAADFVVGVGELRSGPFEAGGGGVHAFVELVPVVAALAADEREGVEPIECVPGMA